jgi:hypothetical protein
MNFFMAGRDLIRWTIDVVDSTSGSGHVRLTMQHPNGSIVEYFPSTESALRREHELEGLLIAARGYEPAQPLELVR